MVVSDIKLYELLKAKLGTAEAEAFVTILENKVEKKFEEKKDALATKEDIHALEEKISNLRAEMLRTYYLVSIGQLVAIVGAVLALVNLLK